MAYESASCAKVVYINVPKLNLFKKDVQTKAKKFKPKHTT